MDVKRKLALCMMAVMLAGAPVTQAMAEDVLILPDEMEVSVDEEENVYVDDSVLIDALEPLEETSDSVCEGETEAESDSAIMLIEGVEEVDASEISEEVNEEAEAAADALLDEAAAVSNTVTEVSDLSSEASNNMGDQSYSYYGSPVYSYLEKVSSGYMRVEYDGSKIAVEYYNSSFTLTSKKYVTRELTYFGGFYAGSDAYYLVFGQSNSNESSSVEVVRVVKYSTAWERLGAASLYGANTTVPFSAGSLRMTEYGGYLYIRTSHQMYTTSDGLKHQANLMIEVDESEMKVTDSYYDIMNVSSGYVSHSFDQFILVDDENNLIAVDLGDAYPRAAILFRYSMKAGNSTFGGSMYVNNSRVNLLEFEGEIGDNYTGASLGGLEYSDSSYLVAGSSVAQDENWSSNSVKNVFVTVTSRNSLATSVNWITDYDEGGSVSASTPQLVKLSSNSFALLWTTQERSDSEVASSAETKLHYVYLDGAGNVTSDVYTVDGFLSDCKPIVSNGSIIWYVTGDTYSLSGGVRSTATTPYFCVIDSSRNFSVKSNLDATAISDIQSTPEGLELKWNSVSGASGYTVYWEYDSGSYTVSQTADVSAGSAGTVLNLTSGRTYAFCVEAYAGNNRSVAAEKQLFYYLATPALSLKKTNSEAQLSWKSVTGAEGYKIYRKIDDGSYVLLATTTDTSWTDSSVSIGTLYTYQVYAYSDSYTSGGSTELSWNLRDISNASVSLSASSYTYDGSAKRPTVTVKYGSDTLTSGTDYTVSYSNNVSVGTATVTVTGKGRYIGTATKSFTISKVSQTATISSLTNVAKGIKIKWNAVSGASGYYIYRRTSSGAFSKIKTIKNASTVSYTDKKVADANGTVYVYKVVPYSSTMTGTGTEKAAVRLTGTALVSVKNSAAGKIKVQWTAVSNVTGYQIQYSTSKTFTSFKKKTLSGATTASKTLKGLTKGKTYYIRIRTYKTVSGTKYYSAWSSKMKVTITK